MPALFLHPGGLAERIASNILLDCLSSCLHVQPICRWCSLGFFHCCHSATNQKERKSQVLSPNNTQNEQCAQHHGSSNKNQHKSAFARLLITTMITRHTNQSFLSPHKASNGLALTSTTPVKTMLGAWRSRKAAGGPEFPLTRMRTWEFA